MQQTTLLFTAEISSKGVSEKKEIFRLLEINC